MTDLTEQWKKGELPSGWYYTKLWKGCNVIDYFIGNQFLRYDDSDIVEVVASVPTFDELQNMNKAVNQAMSANIKLVEQNARLTEQINHLSKTQARQFVDNQKLQVKAEKAKDVVNIDTARQIKQLKDLLKECLEPLEVFADKKNACEWNPEDLLAKIDEVLK